MCHLQRVAQFYKNVTSLFKLNTLKINYKNCYHMKEHILFAMKSLKASLLLSFHNECTGCRRLKDSKIYLSWLFTLNV